MFEGEVGDPLSRVLWIGGSPCAGKTTLAATLAARHELTHK